MNLALKIDVPIASPTSGSREDRETYPVPPPFTVYGMLLSLVGETDRYKHCEVKIALAIFAPYCTIKIYLKRNIKQKKQKNNIQQLNINGILPTLTYTTKVFDRKLVSLKRSHG